MLKLKTLDEYFMNPQPCNAMAEVRAEQQSEEWIEWERQETLRQLRMWNNLGPQIVGAEDPEFLRQ